MKYSKTFYVAGVKFHKLNTVIDEILDGQYLEMVKEPTNKYDNKAIKLIYPSHTFNEKVMVGYVPAKYAAEITALSEKENLVCEIIKVDASGELWKALKVSIYSDDINKE